MRRLSSVLSAAVIAAIAWQSLPLTTGSADAEYGWEGRRRISYQHSKDLFYNQYVGPGASGAPAEMYPSPLPVPAHVGHTYGTYQPFYPNEYLYRHKRSYYNYHAGAGWTRTNARYRTDCGWWTRDVCCGASHLFDVGGLLDACTP